MFPSLALRFTSVGEEHGGAPQRGHYRRGIIGGASGSQRSKDESG